MLKTIRARTGLLRLLDRHDSRSNRRQSLTNTLYTIQNYKTTLIRLSARTPIATISLKQSLQQLIIYKMSLSNLE